jgi:Domain of unknown function (DUF4157)
MSHREVGPSWEFGKVPVLPPERTSTPSPLSLQTKLAVGAVDDPLEQEADRIADQVVRMPVRDPSPQLRRMCASCAAEEEELQRAPSETAKTVANEAPPTVHEALRSPGEPLDGAARAYFEPRFRHDFSRVRVHTGRAAEQSARDVRAHAYTVGHDIVFAPGNTRRGRAKGSGYWRTSWFM